MSSKYNYTLQECPSPGGGSSDHYRLGDCLLNHEIACKNFSVNQPKYKDTFVWEYSKRSNGVLNKYDIAAKIVLDWKDKYKYTFDENTIVIHMRVGDVLLAECKTDYCKLLKYYKFKNYPTHYCNIPNIINKLKTFNNKFNKILIVSAIHYGKLGNNNVYPKVIKEIKTLSYNKIDYLIDNINNLFPNKYNITVQSSTPDRDFFTLCLANNVIYSGQSAFGNAIRNIRGVLNNH